MGTKVTELFSVTLSRKTAAAAQAAFNKLLILAEHTAFAGRAKAYSGISEIAEDFATTDQVYLAADLIFSQAVKPKVLYVGRIDAGDATLTASLNAIKNESDVWYGLMHADPDLAKADNKEISAWAESNLKFFLMQTSEADVLVPATTTDVCSEIKALSRDRTLMVYHDERQAQIQVITFDSDFDASDTVNVVVNGSAGSLVTFAVSHANTLDLIAAAIESEGGAAVDSAVVDATANTITVTAAVGHDASNIVTEADMTLTIGGGSTVTATVEETQAAALNTHLAGALGALQMSKDPGSSNWDYKTVIGVTADEFTGDELTALKAKRAARYESVNDVSFTLDVVMASGEQPFNIHGSDWLVARIAERLLNVELNNERITYTNGGRDILVTQIDAQLKIASKAPYNLINPGYTIEAPDVADADPTDKANKLYDGITAFATYQGAISKAGLTIQLTN